MRRRETVVGDEIPANKAKRKSKIAGEQHSDQMSSDEKFPRFKNLYLYPVFKIRPTQLFKSAINECY